MPPLATVRLATVRLATVRLAAARLAAALAVLAGLSAGMAHAAGTQPAAASAAQTVQAECGACHMAYPPQFLPARSWRAVVAGLGKHFGEIATLEAATRRRVEDYLVANAADVPGGEAAFLRGLRPTDTPIRITDTPLWRAIHRSQLAPGVGTGPGIRTAANCLRCHGGGG